MNSKGILLVTLVVAAGFCTACATRAVVYKEGSPRPVVVEDEHGPPPHAPAHGYRCHHDGVMLVWDSGMAVYVVSGYRDCYYSDGMYFRYADGDWQFSVSINSGWKVVADYHDVPSGPRGRHGNGHGHQGHDNGNHGQGHGKHKR